MSTGDLLSANAEIASTVIMNAIDADVRGAVKGIGYRASNYKILTLNALLVFLFGTLIIAGALVYLTSENKNVSPTVMYAIGAGLLILIIVIIVSYFSWLGNIGQYIYSRILINPERTSTASPRFDARSVQKASVAARKSLMESKQKLAEAQALDAETAKAQEAALLAARDTTAAASAQVQAQAATLKAAQAAASLAQAQGTIDPNQIVLMNAKLEADKRKLLLAQQQLAQSANAQQILANAAQIQADSENIQQGFIGPQRPPK